MSRSEQSPHAGKNNGDLPSKKGAGRANRLVRADDAEHYLRQGERIADAVTALVDAARRATPRLRSGKRSGAIHTRTLRLG